MHSYIVGEFTDMGEFNPGEDTKEGYNGDENSKYPTGDIAEMEIRKNSNMTSCANFNYTWSYYSIKFSWDSFYKFVF